MRDSETESEVQPGGKAPAVSSRRDSFRLVRRSGVALREWVLWGGFVVIITLIALYATYLRLRPPPPPRIANPFRLAAERWKEVGVAPLPLRDVLSQSRRSLRGSYSERLFGFRLIRRGLVGEPDSAEAIAIFATALVRAPSVRDDEKTDLALRGIASAIGRGQSKQKHGELEVARAWLLLETGKLDSARDAAQRATELDPLSFDAQFVRAATDVEIRPESAIHSLDALRKQEGIGDRVLRWKARALVRSGRVREALALLADSMSVVRNGDELKRELYLLRLAMGRTKEGLRLLEEMLEDGQASMADRIRFARYLARVESNSKKAIEVLRESLKDERIEQLNARDLYAELVMISTAARRFTTDPRDLATWLEKGIAMDGESPVLLYGSVLADRVLNRPDRALDSLEVANGLHPEVPEIAIDLAWRLRELDPVASQEVVDDALEANVGSLGLLGVSAVLAYDREETVEAFRYLRRILQIDPATRRDPMFARAYAPPRAALTEIGDALVSVGRRTRNTVALIGAAAIYLSAQDIPRAERAIRFALRLDRTEPLANAYRGILARQQNMRRKARISFRAAWERGRSVPLVQLHMARLRESEGQLADAEALYRAAQEATGTRSSARSGLARTLWRQGRVDEARVEIKRVLELDPNDREMLSFLATVTE